MSRNGEAVVEKGERGGCAVLAMAHGGLGEGIRGLLATQFDSVVLVADERSLIACLEALRPDLLVLDIALVATGGMQFAARLKGSHRELRILLLVADDDPAMATAAAASGVEGCLLMGALGRDLLPAVDEVLGGGKALWSKNETSTRAPKARRRTDPDVPNGTR